MGRICDFLNWNKSQILPEQSIKDRRDQRHLDLFTQRASLRDWLRHGYPVVIPNLGFMKPLRRIDPNPDPAKKREPFYRPFFIKNILQQPDGRLRALVDPLLRLEHGPLPFFPIQILLDKQQALLRRNEEEQSTLERLLGQPVRTWSVEPMLMVYPAGCIAAQLRLYVEAGAPMTIDALLALVHGLDQLPWQIRHLQRDPADALCNGTGGATLLDYLVRQLRRELVSEEPTQPTPACGRAFTLITPQGSLHEPAADSRHKQRANGWRALPASNAMTLKRPPSRVHAGMRQ